MMTLITNLIALALLYWLPGAGLLEILWPGLRQDSRHDRLSRLAIASGLSMALAPILFLWCWTLGIAPGGWLAWLPGVLGGAVVLGNALRRHSSRPPVHTRGSNVTWLDVGIAATVLLIALSRWLTVRDLVAPAWGDSVQHTFIVQLLIDNGGLFESWAPYAPMNSLTYHFGFHTLAASWSWITGAASPQAVLATGQIVGVVAVLALYPLALQLSGGNRVAGWGTLLVAGLLSPLPAYYVNWGRYTQLAGQAILPVFVVILDRVCMQSEDRQRVWTRMGTLTLLGAGLCLTHYRIVGFAIAAGLCWTLAGAWWWRRTPKLWIARTCELAAVAAGTALLIAPWLAQLDQGILFEVHKSIASLNPSIFSVGDVVRAWEPIPAALPITLIAAISVAIALGTLVRERAVWLILGWSGVALLLTNPFLLGIPGTGLVTNFALGIASYIPGALLCGWLLARSVSWTEGHTRLRDGLITAVAISALWGFASRSEAVDPSFELLAESDLRSFAWIRENTPADARFQVNAGIGYGGKTAIGTDGGWWLPLFTQRSSTLPPLPYTMEVMNEKERHDIWATPQWLFRAIITGNSYHPVFCHQGVTHVFLGEKRGTVGGNGEALLPEPLLRQDPHMRVIHQQGRAQVWEFDQSRCD